MLFSRPASSGSSSVTPSMCFFLFVLFLLVQLLSIMTLWSMLGADPAEEAHVQALLSRQDRWRTLTKGAEIFIKGAPPAGSAGTSVSAVGGAAVTSNAEVNEKLLAMLPALPAPLPQLTAQQQNDMLLYVLDKFRATAAELKRVVKIVQMVCCLSIRMPAPLRIYVCCACPSIPCPFIHSHSLLVSFIRCLV